MMATVNNHFQKIKRRADGTTMNDSNKRKYLGDVTNRVRGNRAQGPVKPKHTSNTNNVVCNENNPPTNDCHVKKQPKKSASAKAAAAAPKQSAPPTAAAVEAACETVDFDAPPLKLDEVDDLLCSTSSVYAREIHRMLRKKEISYAPAVRDFLASVQTEIGISTRGVLLDWLVEVAQEYNLTEETLYLTKNYIDRYLAIVNTPKRMLQLLGITCLLIASKFEEVLFPTIGDLVYVSDSAFTKEEVLIMEVNILNVLGFNLASPTEHVFLTRFQRVAEEALPSSLAKEQLRYVSNYLCELTVPEYTFAMYLPSMVAAAAMWVALYTLGFTTWNTTLEAHTGFNMQNLQFRECVKEIFALSQVAPNSALKAVYEKYSSDEHHRVAQRIAMAGQN